MLLDSLLRYDPSAYDIGVGNYTAAQMVDGSAIFGSGSSISHEIAAANSSLLSSLSSWELSSLILLLLVIYCFSAYRYGAMINGCLKSAFSVNGALAMYEFQAIDFFRFIRLGIVQGFLCVSVVCTAILYNSGQCDINLLYVILAVIISLLFMRIWSLIARWIFAIFDHESKRWQAIARVSDHTFVVIAIVCTLPVILISLLLNANFLIETLVSVVTIYYIMKIVLVFKSLRFSFLQSFLYLCAVVAVPLVLIVGTVIRFKLL